MVRVVWRGREGEERVRESGREGGEGGGEGDGRRREDGGSKETLQRQHLGMNSGDTYHYLMKAF